MMCDERATSLTAQRASVLCSPSLCTTAGAPPRLPGDPIHGWADGPGGRRPAPGRGRQGAACVPDCCCAARGAEVRPDGAHGRSRTRRHVGSSLQLPTVPYQLVLFAPFCPSTVQLATPPLTVSVRSSFRLGLARQVRRDFSLRDATPAMSAQAADRIRSGSEASVSSCRIFPRFAEAAVGGTSVEGGEGFGLTKEFFQLVRACAGVVVSAAVVLLS